MENPSPKKYNVQKGDHISSLAKKFGFRDPETLLNFCENSKLKTKRDNPHVLNPGDMLVIPEKAQKQESCETEQRHRFKVGGNRLKLRLILRNSSGEPIARRNCILELDGSQYPLTTDSDGRVEQAISPTAKKGRLILLYPHTRTLCSQTAPLPEKPISDGPLRLTGQKPAQEHQQTIGYPTPPLPENMILNFKIGFLDPVDEKSGWIARLVNLGYLDLEPEHLDKSLLHELDTPLTVERAHELDPPTRKIKLKILSAVQRFQLDENLSVDGICGPNTQAKLKEVHGC